jgi:hypothetical protein
MDEYNLIILTVFQMINWREIYKVQHYIHSKITAFTFTSDKLYENDTLGKNSYYRQILEEWESIENLGFIGKTTTNQF